MTPEMYVAVIALAVAVFEALATRRHNRLSVKPSLRIDRNVVQDDYISVVLKNTGAGPAIFKSIDVFVDSNRLTHQEDPRRAALEKVGINDFGWNLYQLYPGETFAAGEEHFLIVSTKPVKDLKKLVEIKHALFRISFRIKYTSVYNQEFELSLKHNPPQAAPNRSLKLTEPPDDENSGLR